MVLKLEKILALSFEAHGHFPSQAQIAREMGVSRRWVQKLLAELEKGGKIKRSDFTDGQYDYLHYVMESGAFTLDKVF